ncbi:uncharacterized protein LOC143242756 isoform X1 [Tachypleus tridentatus]|uniref:uncharacterized protein LOC143242756 isoform X1 n=1 Tax=Tachypleus tridentatus TaxID=6853 RepID=UPI003FD00695
MTILINFYKDVKACVQPNENYQCPEGLTLRHNLCYPSQPGTEEETYVPSPRKTPSMSEHTIPLVTAAVGIPLLLIFLSVIIWKCNCCRCKRVKSANTEDHTNKDDRKKNKYSLVPQKDEDQSVNTNEKRKCKSVKEKRAENVQNFHLPEKETKANVFTNRKDIQNSNDSSEITNIITSLEGSHAKYFITRQPHKYKPIISYISETPLTERKKVPSPCRRHNKFTKYKSMRPLYFKELRDLFNERKSSESEGSED